MWVLQEIVLARHALFIWGAASISWPTLCAAISAIHANSYLHALLECRNLQNAFLMKYLCEQQRKGESKSHPFLHLLDVARSFDVSEPRDKVYGLLGFSTINAAKESGVFVMPDYGVSIVEVYMQVARTLVEREEALNVLSFVVHGKADEDEEGGNEGKRNGLPSWVPDWNCKDVVFPFMGYRPANRHHAGTARPMRLLPTEDPKCLSLKGVAVDVVSEARDRILFTQLHRSPTILKELVQWCLRANVDALTLAKTLTGGRDVSGTLIQDDEQHLADFIALLQNFEIDLHAVWPSEASLLSALGARKGNPDRATEAVWRYTCYRAPVLTGGGRLGLGPGAARAGDVVAVLWGGQIPFVLREMEAGWKFVGDACVGGLMRGEVMELVESGEIEERVFEMR
ncbi:hypothetical protein BU26DRAFT_513206 [Trematosphaeria pertusa]|uniref:Heterokaryon incompatibility domain-containing protein n=1 Tax=Trematosphaeria pertusa TaxID=390896 RepID=A0A6A6J2E0_9PLEO|nr:uncharacterized protein BU26DRAFT_513206 [Trematosphaeria pertusa]KAF2256372.1 hypothetical protein BU26DRAFT_513206 [Trematosphaeria pertusa]